MKTFFKAFFLMLAIVAGSASDSFAQAPVDVCNPTACALTITVEYDPACAAASGCPATFTFTVPAGACPFQIITPCPCPIISITVTDGMNTYTNGDPAFGYTPWGVNPQVKLCGMPYDIHIGPHHVHIN